MKLQTSILLAGTGISWLAMTILPPWAAFSDGSIDFLGYAPLWAPITDQFGGLHATVHIDFARLAIQYMTVAIVWMVITRIEHTRIDRMQQAQPDAAGGAHQPHPLAAPVPQRRIECLHCVSPGTAAS